MSIHIDKWVPKDELDFMGNALALIRSDSHIGLLAGPGSGKAEVLAQRASFLLETGSAPWPRNILAITRKREAASNIKQRVKLRCGKVLSERFHSFTIEAFTKNIFDRFMSVLPEIERPNLDYTLEFDTQKAHFPESLTFDQITLKAHKIISNSPVILKSIRATYSHIFIDEFQDLNETQYNFIKMIFKESSSVLTIVGDTKQAIMKFANALPDVFERFENDFNAEILPLYINYRSTPELKGFLGRLAMKWWSTSSGELFDTLILPENEYSICCYQNEEHEAQELSLLIQKWITEDEIPPHDIAVLFRVNTNNNYGSNLSNALSALHILSINESVIQDHLSEPIGKILLSLLILITRSRDANAWESLRDLFLFSCGNNEHENSDAQLLEIIDFLNLNRVKLDLTFRTYFS